MVDSDTELVSVITGASRGIGRALALRLGQNSGVVVVGYRSRAAEAEAVVSQIRAAGGRASAVRVDVEDPADIAGLFLHVQKEYGRVDHFVANAAAAPFKPVAELGLHHLDRCHAANSRAFVLSAQRAVELMDRGGRVLAMSSSGGRFAMPGYAAMGTEKAATESWVRYFACEFADRDITVNAICAGFVETDSLIAYAGAAGIDLREYARKTPNKRLGRVEDIVSAAMFLLSPGAGHITGQVLNVDGGMSAGLAKDHFVLENTTTVPYRPRESS